MGKTQGRGRGGSRGGRGRGGRGRGGGGRGGRGGGQASNTHPAGDALAFKATGSSDFIARVIDCPCKPVYPPADGAADVVLKMDSWDALDSIMAWFRDAADIDHEASIEFSHLLTKTQRAKVHTAANSVGLGALVTVSSGIGDQRCVAVVRKGSAAANAAEEKQTVISPEIEAQAMLLYKWAHKEGTEVSQDEAMELMVSGAPMPQPLAELWAVKWPRQQAAEALCAAVYSDDVNEIKTAIASYPHAVKEGATDDRSGVSPVHLAAAEGKIQVLEALIAAGAPLDARDGGGLTALEVSQKFDRSDAEGVLLRAGARDAESHQWPGENQLPESVAAASSSLELGSGDEGGGIGLASAVSVCGTDITANAGDIGSVVEEYQDSEYIPSVAAVGEVLDKESSVNDNDVEESSSKDNDTAATAEPTNTNASSETETMAIQPVNGAKEASTRRRLSWSGATLGDARDEIDALMDEWMSWAAKHSTSLLAGAGAAAVAAGVVLLWRGRGGSRRLRA